MRDVSRRVIATLIATLVALPTPALASQPAETLAGPLTASASVSWKRLGGADRYETMAQISAASFENSTWAVIAAGANFPDALAASSLAGALRCPIILTATDRLSDEASSELVRLGVSRALVVGGKASVSASTVSAIERLDIDCERVSGSDREATSVAVLRKVREINPTSKTLIVATGQSYPDALSIGPWAYQSASPIVLVGAGGTLGSEAIAAITEDNAFNHALLVGGTASVSTDVTSQLGDGITDERLGGADRYETSATIADWSCSEGRLTWATPSVTTGRNFPDALAGATLAGERGSVLLVADDYADMSLKVLRAHAKDVSSGFILGGATSFSIDDPLGEDPTVVRVRTAIQAADGRKALTAIDDAKLDAATKERLEGAVDALAKQGYSVGFVMCDLVNLRGVAYNADALFYGASSIKAPYFGAVVSDTPSSVVSHAEDMQEALTYSWDLNYLNVFEAFGADHFVSFGSEAGASASIATSLPWATYSARDLALLWGRMAQVFRESTAGATLGSWCEAPETSAIHSMLGASYVTRSKAGWIDAAYDGEVVENVNDGKALYQVSNDAGIVYTPSGAYVVAIMSNYPGDPLALSDLVLALDATHQAL